MKMNKKQKDLFGNDVALGKNGGKPKFTKPGRGKNDGGIDREVDRIDYDGFNVARGECFSKKYRPAITFRYGSVLFNIWAVRKFHECSHIIIIINIQKKLLRIKPCDEDDKDSLKWSRVDKTDKVVPRFITGKLFSAQLYKDMGWNIESIVKVLGWFVKDKSRNDYIFEFDLSNAEMYLHLAEAIEDDPKRRRRVAYSPKHWQGNYGQPYDERAKQLTMTFDDSPEGFMKVTIPQLPRKQKDVENLNAKPDKGKKNGSKR